MNLTVMPQAFLERCRTMKKTLPIIICLLLTAAIVASCSGNKPDVPDIPNIGDPTSTSNDSSPSDTSGQEVYDEIKYHEKLGFEIIKSYGSEEFTHAYNIKTYEGLYSLVVDSIYRTKLDIDILKNAGYDDGTFDGYTTVIMDFLKENDPKHLLPRNQSTLAAGKLHIPWLIYIPDLIQANEEQFLRNEALFIVYAFQCKRDALGGADISKRLAAFPDVQKKLVGSSPVVTAQRFDDASCRTVVDIDADDNVRLVFKLGRDAVRCTDTDVYILKKGVALSVPPDYSGDISIAAQNEYGLLGPTVYYTVKSTVEQIPDSQVNFKSSRLEAAIREYLNKPSPAKIKKSDLSSITDIFVNGDLITLNRTGLTVEMINRNTPAAVNDFSFSDIDNFPCLTSLTVKHNRTGDPSGDTVLNLSWLELTDCGISDISGLSGCNIKTLWLADNNITDVSILASATALDNVMLANNPISKAVFPSKAMAVIDMSNTHITDLACLDEVVAMFSFDCSDTNVSDISRLTKIRNIHYLTLPANVDYKIVQNISSLRELVVGDKKIK